MSESDAFGDLCGALQEKYNMDREDFEKLVKLYNDREDFMPKAALFASAAMTIAVLEKLQSTLGPAIQELCDKLGNAEDETKPEWVNAGAVKSVRNVVAANVVMIRTVARTWKAWASVKKERELDELKVSLIGRVNS